MGWLQTIFDRLTREPRDPDARRVPGGVRTLAGVAITPDLALQNPTAWACHRYLTQTVAVCPWHVMRALPTGGKEVAGTHRVDWLLYKRPNPEWGAFQFRETLLSWALLWGNGYAEIERDVLGRPLALWPIHPSRVRVMRDAQTDRLYYEVENGANGKVELAAMDMFHLRGFGDGPVGVSVIEYARESLGWARAAQLFGASFFGNGMNVAGVVQVQKGLQPGGLSKLKAELANLYKGPWRSNKTAVLDAGMEFKPVTIDPNKAQFIETQQHLIEETCRLFGVPPHKVGHCCGRRSTTSSTSRSRCSRTPSCPG
jgi:HK97 family phage portal protein